MIDELFLLLEWEQQQEQAKMQREESISFIPSLQHPPNLPIMRDDSSVGLGLSDRTNPLDMSDCDVLTPGMIQDQRDKEQAKSGCCPQSSSSCGRPSASAPGAIRIGSDSPVSTKGAVASGATDAPKVPHLHKVGSLPSVGEQQLQVEAKLINEDSEFFTAKLEEEKEVYREQMREELKKERENSGIVYATATKDDPLSSLCSFLQCHKWKVLGFLLVLAGGIAATVLIAFAPEPTLAPTSSPTELPLVYDPPTAVECAAISQGENVEGQEDMIVELLDVEVDVSLDSEDVDIATLLPSLEAAMRERLVPALSECPFEEPGARKLLRGGRELGSDNPKYSIANTVLELQDRPGVQCNDASIQPCHRIVMKLELFLKGVEYVSTLMNMVYDVGLKRPVVVTLGVGAPYTVIDFVAINSGTRPPAATLAPTTSEEFLPLVYDPPTPQDCESIAIGLNLEGQDEMVVEFLDVEVDVTLDSDTLDIVSLLPSLEGVMKERLVPALSHCPFQEEGNRRRRLESENPKYVVANTFLRLEDRPGVSCSARSPQPCHRIVMKLQLFLKGHEYVSTLMNLVYDLRKDRPVVETLGLGSPYTAIDFVAINSGTPPSIPNTIAPTTIDSGIETTTKDEQTFLEDGV
mmetsp:Transcript_37532/g.91038  ORF Transcript_37532/g.91038 Transcript_37532/m.91038 type:complete len:635 (-) Transcript_37532:95-1999(-)